MSNVDLRILALADSKRLPEGVQQAFDRYRIRAAQEAVILQVRKRLSDIPKLVYALELLEAAAIEDQIIHRMVELSEVVETYRAKTGLHRDYILMVMSQHLNPWGVVDFQRDFENPMPYVKQAAEALWKLCRDDGVEVESLLKQVKDPLINALDIHYMIRNPNTANAYRPFRTTGEMAD